jgi:uncharacterized protein
MLITDLERNDFPVIREWIDPNLFTIFHAPIDDDQLERLLTRQRDGRLTDLGLKLTDDTGKPLGLVHVVFDWANELGHIQQILVGDPGRRRQGVGSAMMQHTLRLCFEEHRLHRMQLNVWEDNEPAVAFYRKQGFHTDGLMREARKIGDRFIGLYCMSMLRREWVARTGQGRLPPGGDVQDTTPERGSTESYSNTRLDFIRRHVDEMLDAKADRFDARCGCVHLYGVSALCALLAQRRNLNPEIASIIGMLHDISAYASGDPRDHARLSAAASEELLRNCGQFSEEETGLICSAISLHNMKTERHGDYDELLKDADTLQHHLYDTALHVPEKEKERLKRLLTDLL